jgi:putative transposase
MMKQRLVKHYDHQRDAHMLTFSCFHRLPLLSKERTILWFVQAVARSRIKYQFDLWAWVAMPDHAHVLIWPREEGYSTAVILKSIKTSVGKRAIGYLRQHHPRYLNKLKLITGSKVEYHFWQDGPGHDRNLNEPAAIHEEIRYIHDNPEKAGLVDKAINWRWSSARAWVGEATPLLPIDMHSVPRIVSH